MSGPPSSPAEVNASVPPVSPYLRRRSGPQEAAAMASSSSSSSSSNNNNNNASGGTSVNANQSVANRRPSALNSAQNDFSLMLTPLPQTPPMPSSVRSTTPSPGTGSRLVSSFGKQRAADEIQAVADMVASGDIQRPASAPPRGQRSRHTSKEQLDDWGAEMMETAQVDGSPSPPRQAAPSLKEVTLDSMQFFTSKLSDRSLALLFFFIVMWGAVLSLDRLTTYSYQTIATNSFSSHSSLATVSVVRAVVAAIAALPFAVVADLCGRFQAFTVALIFYTAGHILLALSRNVAMYTGGVVLYEIGANALVCLQDTVLADMTSSRNRLFFQLVPQMPFLVFSFISSDIYSAILPQWRWGIGMFALLGPASLLPVIWILHVSQKGQKNPAVSSAMSLRRATIQSSSSTVVYFMRCVSHVWSLADLFGLVLLSSSLSLILIPLTLAAGTPERWESPSILGMVATGVVLVGAFAYWECKKALHPILAKQLLRNRTFWGGGFSLCLLWTARATVISYFPTYLYVVQGTSDRAQQNISVIYSFTVAASSLPIALTVRYTRRYRVFALIGVILFTAGIGLMIPLNGSARQTYALVMSQIVLGLGGAMTIALMMAAVQVSVPHVHVAQAIAAINIFPCMGNGIGAAIAGALWTNLLPGHLYKDLAASGHQRDVPAIFAEPLTWIESYPIGTAARTGVIQAYLAVWRILLIVATIVCAASVLSTMGMANFRLNDLLSVAEESSNSKMNVASDAGEGGRERLFGDRLFERIEKALWGGHRTTLQRAGQKGVMDMGVGKAFRDEKGMGIREHKPTPSSSSNSFSSAKSFVVQADQPNDVQPSSPMLRLTPILVVEPVARDVFDDEVSINLDATAGESSSSPYFRPTHPVQRPSPLALHADSLRPESVSYL